MKCQEPFSWRSFCSNSGAQAPLFFECGRVVNLGGSVSWADRFHDEAF
jgi:hypothetical protein